jgi:protein CWC15
MTTAHRPTFDPARGKSNQATGSILHARALPSHSTIKYRQEGQGGDADKQKRELEKELFEREQEHVKKLKLDTVEPQAAATIESLPTQDEIEERRRKILEEMQNESDDSEEDQDEERADEDDSDEFESDDEQELLIELEKIKRERAEEKKKQEELQQQAREREIAYGNPLLNPKRDFVVKKSWMGDTVFKNQTQKKESDRGFINDMLRSDFHKRFMDKYVR